MLGPNRGSGLFSHGLETGVGQNALGPRQLSLVASQGFSGNGMASIGMDNSFSVIAHLPPPHSFSPYAPAVYAAYLVDEKGKNGFYAGTLRAAGGGMYQMYFRSPVPLVHYDKVVVSLEHPQGIGQFPQGPIIMKVKEGLFDSMGPVKRVGGNIWGKVKGFVSSRFGGGSEPVQDMPSAQQPIPLPNYPAQQPYSPPQQNYTAPQQNYAAPQNIPVPAQNYAVPQNNPVPQTGYAQPPQGGAGYSPVRGPAPRARYPQNLQAPPVAISRTDSGTQISEISSGELPRVSPVTPGEQFNEKIPPE